MIPRALLFIILFLAGCATAAHAPTEPSAATPANVTLTVFAAASLAEAFEEIKADFEAVHPGVVIVYNFGGSNALAQQLGQEAPADLFASANASQMQVAIEAGRIIGGTSRVFVHNRLVVVVPTGNPGGVATLQDLARPGLMIVLAAAEVPVGQYALDFLDKAATDPAFGPAFKDDVLANVVSYEENVRAVLTKIVLGEGDAGIVYASDISGDSADQVERLDIPDDLNTVASYPIGVIQDSTNPDLAQAFMEYVLSPEAQAVLASHGFIPAAGD